MSRKIAISLGAVLAALLWGEAQFIIGFNAGADSSLCVMAGMFDDPDRSACKRVPAHSPAMVLLRMYRALSGDAVA